MKFTQGFGCNYSAGKTDGREVELSIICFSKHSLPCHPGISEMIVPGLEKYIRVVSHMRVTNQKMNMCSFSLLCFITRTQLASALPLGFGAFAILHQSGQLPCLIATLILRAKSICFNISLYFWQPWILNIAISFFKIFSSLISSLWQNIWYWPINLMLQGHNFSRTVLNRLD